MFGAHSLLGNTAASRAGLEQAAYLQKQQINLLRAQAGFLHQGSGLNDAAVAGMMAHQSESGASASVAAALRRQNADANMNMTMHMNSNVNANININAKQSSKKPPSYYDASQLPDPPSDDDEDDAEVTEDQDEKGKKGKGAYVETFPQKLFRMIEEADTEGKEDVVSFFPHGRAFAIHKPRTFITEFMPRYFSTSRMSSFQRQLNLYGFRRITEGRDKGKALSCAALCLYEYCCRQQCDDNELIPF